jgi:uncharacterized spore protein YtfJ
VNTIADYITFRYRNWHDFAAHMARVNHFTGWEDDLLNDVICDLMKKPAEKLERMLNAKTSKIVNGLPTTELDKFVLTMLRVNACSQVAPFRKNTLGHKIISRANNKIEVQHSTELTGFDCPDTEYTNEMSEQLDVMHSANINRLHNNEFNSAAITLYIKHFVNNIPLTHLTEAEAETVNRIKQFLTTTKKTLFDDTTGNNHHLSEANHPNTGRAGTVTNRHNSQTRPSAGR